MTDTAAAGCAKNGGGVKRPAGQMQSRNEAKRQKMSLTPGVRGVFVSASSYGAARKAVMEISTLVEKHVEGEATSSVINDTTDIKQDTAQGVVDVDAAIAGELAAGGGQCDKGKMTKRFHFIPDVTKGVSFLKFNRKDDDPSEIVRSLLSAARTRTATSISCRFASKLIPVQLACKPHIEELRDALRSVIAEHFPLSKAAAELKEKDTGKSDTAGTDTAAIKSESEEKENSNGDDKDKPSTSSSEGVVITWCVKYSKRQNMRTLPKDLVCDTADDLVGPNYKVNLTNPEIVILIEVNPMICGIAVCKEYFALAKYNIYRICHPEEEKQIASGHNSSRYKQTAKEKDVEDGGVDKTRVDGL